jgi:hypothetical protein
VLKQYDKVITTLRAEAHLLHAYNTLPIKLSSLTKGKRKRNKIKLENLIKTINKED